MEDILASIRRIIADDQSRNASVASALRKAQPAAEPQSAAHGDAPASAPVVQDEPALDPAEEPVPEEVASSATPHLNVPEVHIDPPHEAVIEEIANVGVASILRPQFAPSVTVDPPHDHIDAGVSETPEFHAHDQPADDRHGEIEMDFYEEPEQHPGHAADAVTSFDNEPLVSEAAGASIGSSFQALATTVFLQNSDAVERMMRDMLRPMLKTWLDDNLPTIVERLVRIEIERVARGGRG